MYPDPHFVLEHDHTTVLIACFALAILYTLTVDSSQKVTMPFLFFVISVAIWIVWRAAQM